MALFIVKCMIEELDKGCITDRSHPRLTYVLQSNVPGTKQIAYRIQMQGWDSGRIESEKLPVIELLAQLQPLTEYEVKLTVWDNHGSIAEKTVNFCTGKMNMEWKGKWITDLQINPPKGQSPCPLIFWKFFQLEKPVKRVLLLATAVGNYYIQLNGKRIGEDYLAPGYTSYKSTLQYQMYDITSMTETELDIYAIVSGGWAAGRFGGKGASGAYHKRQLFSCEIRIEYKDDTSEILKTDSSWKVSNHSPYQVAGIYDGVRYDANIELNKIKWKNAEEDYWKYSPELIVTYGLLPKIQMSIIPVASHMSKRGGTIFDFGQNAAGVISLKIGNARAGQLINIKHGEILEDGELVTANVSQADYLYTCKEGEQEFTPELTYMGFRYIRVQGIEIADIEVRMEVISSIGEATGDFRCSDDRINRLQSNIQWSARSNFVDIPTDCPQRDERWGWTGDIAMFASTACFNFNMGRFLEKWLRDVATEQKKSGDISFIVPAGNSLMPAIATAGWGDSITLVPWALYLRNGDKSILQQQNLSMIRLMKAESRWSRFMSFGKKRYVWKGIYQFGDWLSPGENMKQWQKKGPWIATPFFYNSCKIVENVLSILGNCKEAERYRNLAEKIENSYREVFTDGLGNIISEFQTAYACPVYFEMLTEEERLQMGNRLACLVKNNQYKIGTGFLGTPFILFALSDTGHEKEAYQMLLQEECPGWLYSVKLGATTTWECWDAVTADGKINRNTDRPRFGKTDEKEYDIEDSELSGLSSLNHYAYGAIGDWLYRRVAGIEAIEPGFRKFLVKPTLGGGLDWVECNTDTVYGKITVKWKRKKNQFIIYVEVPVSTECMVIMPDESNYKLEHGIHNLSCVFKEE